MRVLQNDQGENEALAKAHRYLNGVKRALSG